METAPARPALAPTKRALTSGNQAPETRFRLVKLRKAKPSEAREFLLRLVPRLEALEQLAQSRRCRERGNAGRGGGGGTRGDGQLGSTGLTLGSRRLSKGLFWGRLRLAAFTAGAQVRQQRFNEFEAV